MYSDSAATIDVDKERYPLRMHPGKFAMWLFIVSIIMIFTSLSSAYIVRKSQGNWYEFEIPQVFIFSTIAILISSITAQWALYAAKKDNFKMLKTAISITMVLGIAFLFYQYKGWEALVAKDVYFVGNPSGSFMYVFTGLHGVHLIAGLVYLLIIFILSFMDRIHSQKLSGIQMCVTFWHFLDGLWIFLFLFLQWNH